MDNSNINIKYLLGNEQDARWGLTVNCVGFQHISPGEKYPPADHPSGYSFATTKGRVLNEYQLVYISRGRGIFQSKSQEETNVGEGDMFMLFPGEWHNYHPDKTTGWDEYWIGFNGQGIEDRINGGFFKKEEPVFHIGINEHVVETYLRAITTANEQTVGYQQILAGYASLLMAFAFSLERHNKFENQEMKGLMQKAMVLMMERFKSNVRPEEIAKEINMGYSKFRRLFKQYTGYAPFQYIQELRLSHSRELLTNSNKSMAEIAYAVGYENTDYFSTAFKKKNHMTPMAYRKMSRGMKK